VGRELVVINAVLVLFNLVPFPFGGSEASLRRIAWRCEGMFQRILIPLDFTNKNLRALEVALKLAQQNRSDVTLLHVIELIEHLPKEELQGFYQKLEGAARERMNFPASMFLAKDLVVDSVIVYGRRADEIATFAAANQMDLIVLSSHKVAPDAPAQSFGTISHKVAILAPCPVLLVK
jgi:universal stress protein A